MSNSIRDLIVSIDFSDIDVSELIAVDTAIDEIEDQLRQMGHQIEDAGDEFSQMGIEALLAAGAAEEALQSVEDAAEDAEHDVRHLGDAFEVAGIKAIAMGAMWKTAIVGAIAVAAPLLFVAGGLAASAVAAGGAMAAYGAVAMPVMAGLIEQNKKLDELHKKVADAKTAKEKAAAQKELAAAMADVSKEEKFALTELNNFKDFWGKFKAQFEPEILNQFGTGLHILQGILEGLKPTIDAVSGVVTKLLESFDQDLSNGGMKQFFDWLATNGAGAIYNFATIGGNLIGGFFNILKAFSPIGAEIEQGLVDLSDKFLTWSQGLENSQGFQNFVDYARTNGPILVDTISNIWDIFKKLIEDLAPLGTVVLTALDSVTSAINDNWPAVKDTVLSLGAAIGSFIFLMKGMQIIGIVTTLIKALRAGTLLATAAELGFNAALWANPITWVVALIAVLIGAIVLIARHWDTVKQKTQQFWAVIKDNPLAWIVAGPIMALITAGVKLYQNWDKVKSGFSNVWSSIESGAVKMVSSVIGQINKLIGFVNKIPGINIPKIAIASKVPYKKSAKSGGGSDGAGTVSGAWLKAHGYATGLESVPYDNMPAYLHKDEAVLTAKQSNALRAAGILTAGGNKPKLSIGQNDNVAPTGKMRGSSTVFAPSVKVEVNGASGDANAIGKAVAKAAKNEIEKLFLHLGLAYD
jgi:hypothetical protein